MSSKEKDPSPREVKSDISPAVSTDAIMRFLAFTIAMITLPLSTYWVCVYKIPALGGSTTLGGALAAVVANVILVSYLGIIMLEDSQERKAESDVQDEKKTQ